MSNFVHSTLNCFINESANDNHDTVLKDIISRIDNDSLTDYMKNNNWKDIDSAIEYYLYDEFTLRVDDNGIIEFDKLNSDIEELIGDNMVKLYHFTSSKFLNSIKKEGLIAGKTKTNPYSNSYSGIYLTTRTSGNEINGYKYHIVNKHKKGIILVTVKMFLYEIEQDIDDIGLQSGDTQFISDDISPNRIISIDNVLY